MDRSATGDVVGFNFLGIGGLNPGDRTDILIIETNTKTYTQGLVSIQDGSAGSGPALSPAAAVPEPLSMGMLGGGLLLLGVCRFLRRD